MSAKFLALTLVVTALLFSSALADQAKALQAMRELRKDNKLTFADGLNTVVKGIIRGTYTTQESIKAALSRQKFTSVITVKYCMSYANDDGSFPFDDAALKDPKYDTFGYAEILNQDGDMMVGILLAQTNSGSVDINKLAQAVNDWRAKNGKTKPYKLNVKLSTITCKYANNKNFNYRVELESYYPPPVSVVHVMASAVKGIDGAIKAWQDSPEPRSLFLDGSSTYDMGFCANNAGQVDGLLVKTS